MSLDPILGSLNDFPFFGGIDAESLEKMGDLFKREEYPAGEHIIDEGTRGDILPA